MGGGLVANRTLSLDDTLLQKAREAALRDTTTPGWTPWCVSTSVATWTRGRGGSRHWMVL